MQRAHLSPATRKLWKALDDRDFTEIQRLVDEEDADVNSYRKDYDPDYKKSNLCFLDAVLQLARNTSKTDQNVQEQAKKFIKFMLNHRSDKLKNHSIQDVRLTAVEHNMTDVALLAIEIAKERKIDFDEIFKNTGDNALHKAVINNNFELVEALCAAVENNAELLVKNNNQSTPIDIALEQMTTDPSLLNISILRELNKIEPRLLVIAFEKKYYDLVKIILQSSIDITAETLEEVIFKAAQQDSHAHAQIILLALEKAKKQQTTITSWHTNVKTGHNALHYAVATQNVDIIEAFYNYCPDSDSFDGNTAVFMASKQLDLKDKPELMLRKLLTLARLFTLSKMGSSIALPVYCALTLPDTRQGQELVDFFIEKHADINDNKTQKTCLLAWALNENFDEFVQLQLEKNSKVSSDSLRAVFFAAIRLKKIAVAQLALEKAKERQVNINEWLPNEVGDTALHAAVKSDDVKLVKTSLCDLAADRSKINLKKKTPMTVALEARPLKGNQLAIIEMLDEKGRCAAEIAFDEKHETLLQAILDDKNGANLSPELLNQIATTYVSKAQTAIALAAISKLQKQETKPAIWSTVEHDNVMHLAVKYGHVSVVTNLCKLSSITSDDRLYKATNNEGETALHLALRCLEERPNKADYLQIIYALLKADATAELNPDIYQALLKKAVDHQLDSFATYLVINKKADVNGPYNENRSILAVAIDIRSRGRASLETIKWRFVEAVLAPENQIPVNEKSLHQAIDAASKLHVYYYHQILMWVVTKAKAEEIKIKLNSEGMRIVLGDAFFENNTALALFVAEANPQVKIQNQRQHGSKQGELNLLHQAVINNNIELIKLIVDRGEDSFFSDKQAWGHWGCLTLLEMALDHFTRNQSAEAQKVEEKEKGKDKEKDAEAQPKKENSDATIIRLLLTREIDSKKRHQAYRTLITEGYSPVVLELIKQDENQTFESDCILLSASLEQNDLELAKVIFDRGGNFSWSFRETSTSVAVLLKNIDEYPAVCLPMLAALYTRPTTKNITDMDYKQSIAILEKLIKYDHSDVVIEILNNNHNICIQDNTTLFTLAMQKRKLALAVALLKRGANIDFTTLPKGQYKVKKQNQDEYLELTTEILGHPATDSNKLNTMLFGFIKKDADKLAFLAIKIAANRRFTLDDEELSNSELSENKNHMLHYAVMNANAALIQALCENLFTTNPQNADQPIPQTPLDLAFQNFTNDQETYLPIIKTLLIYGKGIPMEQYIRAFTILMNAACFDAVTAVLQERIVSLKDNADLLHQAIEHKQDDLAIGLLIRGADFNAKKDGKNALELAINAKCHEVVDYMVRYADDLGMSHETVGASQPIRTRKSDTRSFSHRFFCASQNPVIADVLCEYRRRETVEELKSLILKSKSLIALKEHGEELIAKHSKPTEFTSTEAGEKELTKKSDAKHQATYSELDKGLAIVELIEQIKNAKTQNELFIILDDNDNSIFKRLNKHTTGWKESFSFALYTTSANLYLAFKEEADATIQNNIALRAGSIAVDERRRELFELKKRQPRSN